MDLLAFSCRQDERTPEVQSITFVELEVEFVRFQANSQEFHPIQRLGHCL